MHPSQEHGIKTQVCPLLTLCVLKTDLKTCLDLRRRIVKPKAAGAVLPRTKMRRTMMNQPKTMRRRKKMEKRRRRTRK